MRLVGATDSFVRRPFIVEGIVEGLMAGVVAVGFVEIGYRIASRILREYIPIERVEVNSEIYIGMLLFGMTLGWFSSRLSVSRFLKESM